MTKIIFKREDCIGCGNCVDISPFYWKMEPADGLAILIGSKQQGKYCILDVVGDDMQENQEAEKLCPLHIIKIKA